MSAKKKRMPFSLSDEAITKLRWITEEDAKKIIGRHYPSTTIERLIENEYKIRKTFR